MRKKLVALLGLLIILSAVFVVYLSRPPEQPTRVRIGYLPISVSLPLFVAQEQGYFAEEGVDIELVEFQTSNQLIEAVVGDRADVGAMVSVEVLFSVEIASPGKFKAFLTSYAGKGKSSAFIIVRGDSEVQNIQQLKGKKIGVFPGPTMRTYARLVLEDVLGREMGITFLELPPTTQIEALNTGQVDALLTMDPIATIGVKKAGARIVESGVWHKHIMDPFPGGMGVLSTRFANDKPTLARKVVAVFDRAVDYMQQHPQEARKSLAKYTPMDLDIAQVISVVGFWKRGEENMKKVQELADILHRENVLTTEVDTSLMYLRMYAK